MLFWRTGPSTLRASSATGPSRAWCVVNELLYASSTPLLGDAARRRRRSWPGRAANVFFRMLSRRLARRFRMLSRRLARRIVPMHGHTTSSTLTPTAGPAPGPTPSPTAGPTQHWDCSPDETSNRSRHEGLAVFEDSSALGLSAAIISQSAGSHRTRRTRPGQPPEQAFVVASRRRHRRSTKLAHRGRPQIAPPAASPAT